MPYPGQGIGPDAQAARERVDPSVGTAKSGHLVAEEPEAAPHKLQDQSSLAVAAVARKDKAPILPGHNPGVDQKVTLYAGNDVVQDAVEHPICKQG